MVHMCGCAPNSLDFVHIEMNFRMGFPRKLEMCDAISKYECMYRILMHSMVRWWSKVSSSSIFFPFLLFSLFLPVFNSSNRAEICSMFGLLPLFSFTSCFFIYALTLSYYYYHYYYFSDILQKMLNDFFCCFHLSVFSFLSFFVVVLH